MARTNETKHTELLAWCAGLFEGEGWVCLHRRKAKDRTAPRADVMAGVVNSDVLLLQPFVDTWGGRLRSKGATKLTRKQCYEWRLECAKAETFLRAIEPYLRGEKANKVNDALALRDMMRARGLTGKARTQRARRAA